MFTYYQRLYSPLIGDCLQMGDQPVAKPFFTQTSMPQVGFELMTPVSKQAKTVHVSDSAANVIS
jgi:hypothetical protein